ncbi:hypothetical protein AXF42_Ash009700 [Apostasia shenzhenica]|uniref:Uncharacterized protein n=1 Tax=Apostasia shenzhenica TaxID=1088818 RepID=A0A2I0AWX8_9ASPA|nr:hypothetical protein AXF42_Ash009700 [Apostasia shenzhenica]
MPQKIRTSAGVFNFGSSSEELRAHRKPGRAQLKAKERAGREQVTAAEEQTMKSPELRRRKEGGEAGFPSWS